MGVTSKHDGEIAAGLAYWAAHWQRLGVALGAPAESVPSADPLLLLERVRNDPRFAFDRSKAPDLIDDALIAVGGLSGFGEVIDWLDPSACKLSDIAHAAGALYGATGDFTALHTATASQAAARTAALRGGAEGFAAVAVARRGRCLHRASAVRPFPRRMRSKLGAPRKRRRGPSCCAAPSAQDDEHTVKLCYSALSLGRLTGDRLFRWLAAREVGALKDIGLPAWRR